MPRRRAEGKAGDRTPGGENQKLKLLAYRVRVAQIMMVLDQAAEQPFEFTTPYLPDLDGSQLFYRTTNRRLVDVEPRGLPAPTGKRVNRKAFLDRKPQQPGSIAGQHESATDHVTQLPVGLSPIPGFTDQFRKRSATGIRIICNQTPHGIKLLVSYLAAAISYDPFHMEKHSGK